MRSSLRRRTEIVVGRHGVLRLVSGGLVIGCMVLCSGCMNDYGDLDFVDDLPDAARGPAKATAAAQLPQQQAAPTASSSGASTAGGEVPSTPPEQSASASAPPAPSETTTQ